MKSDDTHHDETIHKVHDKAEDIEKKFAKGKALKALMEQGQLMIQMVKDYVTREYREVPYWAISAVALSLLYVLNPLDVIPDVILGIGYLDDATVVAFALRLIEKELEKYKSWKDQRLAGRKVESNGKIVDV